MKGWRRDIGASTTCSVLKAKDSRQWKPIIKWKAIKKGLVTSGSHGVGFHSGSFLWWHSQVSCSSLWLLLASNRTGWMMLTGSKWVRIQDTWASCKARGGCSSCMAPREARWGCASTVIRCLQPAWGAGEVVSWWSSVHAKLSILAEKEGADVEGPWRSICSGWSISSSAFTSHRSLGEGKMPKETVQAPRLSGCNLRNNLSYYKMSNYPLLWLLPCTSLCWQKWSVENWNGAI